ncbi:enoyl-CoA hydratase-related protein [Brevibacillus nitrificans]|uniref:enoyl-CoA hydratase-related protein n=1 Tax=Brevibacillus nitrificans TaxID=651560 RepID=UPI002E24F65E|nr:enoyl-CoA hydratase-related protein [Brevibacillus nitrificans]
MKSEFIICEREDQVAVVTINRPPINPLNTQVLTELAQIMGELEANHDVRAIILTGQGEKAFVAGADIHQMLDLDHIGMMEMNNISRRVFTQIENLSKPVIAAINGLALGGGLELALACDLRISTEKARFAFPEMSLGIIPGAGGTQRLQRLVGQTLAKELLYFGEMIDAQRALDIHLINKVVPTHELLSTAKEWAQKLVQKPAIALRMMKQAVNTGASTDLETALTIESACFGNAFATEDRREGMQAFVEKRKPIFVGK